MFENNTPPAGDNFEDFNAASQSDGLSMSEARPSPWRKLNLTRGNLVLVASFALGAAALYLLSLRGGPAEAQASNVAIEQQVETFIAQQQAQPTDQAAKETRRIVDAFYSYATRIQVPIEQLHANPFIFQSSGSGTQAPPPTEAEMVRQRELAAATAEFDQLRLQSVMMGPRGGTAIINNDFLSEGQTVGRFRVDSITARSVQLSWSGQTFVLHMEQ